jgi:hypothetical protein
MFRLPWFSATMEVDHHETTTYLKVIFEKGVLEFDAIR